MDWGIKRCKKRYSTMREISKHSVGDFMARIR